MIYNDNVYMGKCKYNLINRVKDYGKGLSYVHRGI